MKVIARSDLNYFPFLNSTAAGYWQLGVTRDTFILLNTFQLKVQFQPLLPYSTSNPLYKWIGLKLMFLNSFYIIHYDWLKQSNIFYTE